MTRKYKKRGGGGLLILNPANFTAQPNRFPSSYAKVNGLGCAGTKSNAAAAAGKYVPYGQTGGSVYCTSSNPLISGLNAGYASVNACPTPIGGRPYRPLEIPVKLPFTVGGRRRRTKKSKRVRKHRRQMGGAADYVNSGNTVYHGSEGGVVYNGGGGIRRQRGGKITGDTDPRPIGTTPFGPIAASGGGGKRRSRRGGGRRGTKSKTHRGKNYETRKSSKRYRSGKFKKYLRGRKTMRAPDFPFAGGAPSGRASIPNHLPTVSQLATVPSSPTPPVYHQPYSNIPYTPGHSTGGRLPGGLSALANPAPYTAYNHCPSK